MQKRQAYRCCCSGLGKFRGKAISVLQHASYVIITRQHPALDVLCPPNRLLLTPLRVDRIRVRIRLEFLKIHGFPIVVLRPRAPVQHVDLHPLVYSL